MIVTPGQLSRRAELYHQLGAMISSGIPLIRSLEMAATNPEVRASRRQVLRLIEGLKSGLTLADSMTQAEGWLPDFDMALLSVGEKTGRLDVSFRRLSDYYSTRARIIRDTIAGLVTTLATLHVFLLIFPLGLLISFVMGIFEGNFAKCIPFLVQKAVVFGGGYLAVFLLIWACQGNRGEYWRSIVEGFSGIIPILRTARRYLVLARLSGALEALVSSGVSIVYSWELAGAASGSPDLRRTVLGWRRELDSGVTPSSLVNRTGFFPAMFANLYETGEVSGRLDESLRRLADYFEDEGFRKLRLFTRVMNGTIYGLVVLLVAYNVFSFYLGRINTLLDGV